MADWLHAIHVIATAVHANRFMDLAPACILDFASKLLDTPILIDFARTSIFWRSSDKKRFCSQVKLDVEGREGDEADSDVQANSGAR